MIFYDVDDWFPCQLISQDNTSHREKVIIGLDKNPSPDDQNENNPEKDSKSGTKKKNRKGLKLAMRVG